MQPTPSLGPRFMTEMTGAVAGVPAQIGGAVSQVVRPVTHAARDVVKAVAQGLRVEPAARIDAFPQPFIARRTRPLIQQEGGDTDPRQHGDNAGGKTRVFADLVHCVELSNHRQPLLETTVLWTGANRAQRGSDTNRQAASRSVA
ncbi:hypothetical protein D3C80_1490710 [compost metagenome]